MRTTQSTPKSQSATAVESGPQHLDYDEPVLRYHQLLADLTDRRLPFEGRAIDFGCGPGQILGRLRELRADIELVGVDGDSECLRRAKERCPTATLVQDDIANPTAENVIGHRFDVIVSSHSLEHVADPVGALRRWRELLTDSGRLVIAVPNSLQPLLLARALTRRPKANEGHYFIWDQATFHNFCRLAGFDVVAQAADYVPLAPVRVRQRIPGLAWLERALLKPFPQFTNSHVVVLKPQKLSSPEPDFA